MPKKKEKLTEADLADMRTIFTLARKAYIEHREDLIELIKLEDRVFKILENGNLQSTTDKRAGSKKPD